MYRRALLFVDNAGSDYILGMIPLARELLRQGTDVVICANEEPSINDMTVRECQAFMPALAQICPIFRRALLESPEEKKGIESEKTLDEVTNRVEWSEKHYVREGRPKVPNEPS